MAFQYNDMAVDNAHINVNLTADGASSSAVVTFPKEMISPLQIPGVGFPALLSAPSTFLGETVTSTTFDFAKGQLSVSLSGAPSAGQWGTFSMVYGYPAS